MTNKLGLAETLLLLPFVIVAPLVLWGPLPQYFTPYFNNVNPDPNITRTFILQYPPANN